MLRNGIGDLVPIRFRRDMGVKRDPKFGRVIQRARREMHELRTARSQVPERRPAALAKEASTVIGRRMLRDLLGPRGPMKALLVDQRPDPKRDVSIGLTPDRTYSGFLQETADAVSARSAGTVDSVIVWTIDRDTEIAELLYYSVDGIITDDAALVRLDWQASLN